MYIVILGFSCFSVFFFFLFDFPFKAPGLRLPPQVWLAFCMASISIYCHNNNNNNSNSNNYNRHTCMVDNWKDCAVLERPRKR